MIRFFADHPTAAFLLALAFAALGLVSLPGLQRDTFPDFRTDRLEVRAVYPGATAEEIEETVCLAVENALDGVTGIGELACTARANVGLVHIDVEHGEDTGRVLSDVRTGIDAIDTFPPQIERPVVRQLDMTHPVASLALTGPMSDTDLKSLAEDIKARLVLLPGVAEVTIGGFSERQIEVSLDAQRLRAYGLSAATMAAAIEQQSLDLPAGFLRTGERDFQLRFADRRRTVAELERIVLREGSDGGTVRLGDVAAIDEGFVDAEVKTLFNGERAALINIRRGDDDDALRVLASVETFADDERVRLPAGVTLAITNDLSSLIADRLNMLMINALQGFVLICLVLWIFFSARFSLTVAAALPLSLLAAVFVLDLLDYNLNLISTVGLLISVGLLIDSAIVINENIARHSGRGLSAVEAATRGLNEVAGAVTASFLTSVAIFLPLAFLEGDIGRVLLVLPIVLVIVLAASLVVSFLILPRFTARALANVQPSRLRSRIDSGFDFFRDRIVGGLVRQAVTWRYLTLGLVAFAFLSTLSLLAGGTVKFMAFPDIEGDIVEARLTLVAGTPFERTARTVDELLAALERVDARLSPDNPDRRPLVENVTVEFSRNPDFSDQGPHLATVKADLLGSQIRAVRLHEILDAWRSETGQVSDLVSLTFKQPALGPAGHAIEIRLVGDELEALRRAGGDLIAVLERYDGVVDLTSNLHAGPPEIRLTLGEGAGRLDIDAATLASQMRATFQGATADELQIGRESVRVEVRHDAEWRADLGRLEDLVITLQDGRQVPLSAVAEFQYVRGMALIPRVDGRRTLTVTGDVDTAIANVNEVLSAVEAEFQPLLAERHPGIAMSLEGQAASQAETAGSVQRVFVIGLMAMFIVLSFQFRSFIEPAIVMLAIPLALTGVVIGHWLMGLDMSMPSVVGFVSLAGIVVNNSILLVVFIRRHLDAGRPVAEAAMAASLDRFRAIFITTATTIAGLIPLLFETSTQALVLIPLVTSLVFGLLAATLLVLFLVPALYVILADLRPARPSFETQRRQQPAPA
jgi:hydrophobic/amphiphilic exporter-1 (mainly G- bacteria), HAE1 family